MWLTLLPILILHFHSISRSATAAVAASSATLHLAPVSLPTISHLSPSPVDLRGFFFLHSTSTFAVFHCGKNCVCPVHRALIR